MNKNYKKSVAAFAALSIAATTAVVPVNVFADETSARNIAVESGEAIFTSDVAAVGIVAEYDGDRLTSVVKVDVPADGTAAKLPVKEGDKVMLWDSLNGMTPLADAVTVQAVAETTAPTDEATATPEATDEATATPEATDAPTATPEATDAPTATPGATENPDATVWKFDFGSADDVAEGYTAVTADTNYVENGTYGFIGTNEKDYNLGDRLDGFDQQKGQVIQLQSGGTTGLNDAIGSVGEDTFGNSGEDYYPVRFALKVEDEQYFKVTATVTTLDPTKSATASLYTERKHPLYTEKEIPAGETVTTTFTIRTTPIYYQKSDPQGAIADGMVNVALLGENTALASLEIEQLDSAPTLWVLGDSTVTDGGGALPFFPLQNYTGVGTGLTKYIPEKFAMVNEGEGGLNAADSLHFNMVKDRIKAGDYLYVEYGHNHKSDGTAGYLSCLDKYYELCSSVGAKLIIVSPIERINSFTDGAYQHSLRDFATTGEQYVNDKIAAGAKDIAYVDLNQYSLDFYNKIVNDNGGDSNAIKYYFQTAKGGATDPTHPNDAGAENLAYCFIEAAKAVTDETQKAVLADLLTGLRDETPNLVSTDVIAGGLAGEAWPTYIVEDLPELPVQIKNVEFDDDGYVSGVDVNVRKAKLNMDAYGIVVITITDENGAEVGKVYSIEQVDNSTGEGPQTIEHFTKDVALQDGYSYTAQILKAVDNGGDIGLTVDPSNVAYSSVYEPTNVAEYLVPGADTDDGEAGTVETFEYYNASSLTDATVWKFGGSAGHDLSLGKDGDVPYVRIMSDGAKNGAANQGSFYIMREMENLTDGTGSTGQYMIDVDIEYTSGSGLNFAFAKTTTPTRSPFVSDQFTAFTIGSDGKVTISGSDEAVGQVSATSWTNVKYILDMSAGTASISVAGGTPVVVDVPAYQTFGTPTIDTLKHFIIEGQKVAFDVKLSNLTVAKLKDSNATSTLTASVAEDNKDMGIVEIAEETFPEGTIPATVSKTVSKGSTAFVTAVPNTGYIFTGWTADGESFSDEADLQLRMYKDLALTATFAKQSGIDGIVSYDMAPKTAYIKKGESTEIELSNVVDKDGNPVEATIGDVELSCDTQGVSIENGIITIGDDFEMGNSAVVDVTVNGVLNGVEKSCIVFVNSCAYIEDFSTLSTSTLASNGWVSVNAQDSATIEQDSDHGSYLQFAMGQINDRNVKGTFPTEANLSEDYVLEFDMAVTPGNNHASDIAVYDTSASVGNNSPVDANYILKLNNGAANSTSWTVNGSSDTVELAKGEWIHYYLLVKPADQTVEIVISNGTTELFHNTEAINGTGILGGINILSGRYYGTTKLDNIKVYTADKIQG